MTPATLCAKLSTNPDPVRRGARFGICTALMRSIQMKRRRPAAVVLQALATMVLAACSSKQPAPTDCLGRPVDAARPPSGTALLRWNAPLTRTDGSSFDDLAGYRINYGVQPDQLRCQIEMRDPKASSGRVTGLSPGIWYFTVVSFDSGLVESEPSEVVSKQID